MSLEKVYQKWKDAPGAQRLSEALGLLHDLLTEDALKDDQILYTSFSKWAYFRQKHAVPGPQARAMYWVRSELQNYRSDPSSCGDVDHLLSMVDEMVRWVFQTVSERGDKQEPSIEGLLEDSGEYEPRSADTRLLLEARLEGSLFVGRDPLQPEIELQVELPKQKSIFKKDISAFIGSVLDLPLYIHAFEVEVKEGRLRPGYVVLLPDYLIDVTAIAGGYMKSSFTPWIYLMQKVLPREVSYYMMLGNIVNDLLDRLIKEPDLDLGNFYPRVFQRNALQIHRMEDAQVETLVGDIRRHFVNLKEVINNGLLKLGIKPEGCSLEPSFLSSKYGIQGRLDVLFQGDQTAIIELKSGKPYQPNEHGIKWDHYVQTLLYDLLLKSTGVSEDSRNFILYSSQSKDALRYAPPQAEVQKRSIISRNHLVILDALLRHSEISVVEKVFKALLQEDLARVSSFAVRDADRIRKVIAGCTRTEWVYYLRFLVFIQNEVAMAKLGQTGRVGRPGHAGLWLLSREEKHEEFNLLDGLNITAIEEDGQDVFIHMDFSEVTNVMANFRVGDVVVLYPEGDVDAGILHHQVIKGSLIGIGGGRVVLRPRGSQIDRKYLLEWSKWTIERDVLDSSFKSMYDSLFYFLQSQRQTKELWLGIRPPLKPRPFETKKFSEDLLSDQVDLVSKALSAQEYFLIWGPPGSGKTSRVIRELVRQYFEGTESDLYLLAYTNRAVDELGSMVGQLGGEIKRSATRLGSRFAADQEAKDTMLQHQLTEVKDRRGLKTLLDRKRVFLSTVASFWSQKDVVKAESHNILIVDEASQILEPTIIGLLSFFDKVILVGDHVQLPAVSQQSDPTGLVKERELIEVGITQTKMSFFQRLYMRCKEEGWEHAHGILKFQGRMHKDIMDVANSIFYEGQLRIIEGLDRLSLDDVRKDAVLQRLAFIEVGADPARRMLKNSPGESAAIIHFLRMWLSAKGLSISDLQGDTIGIITPFRAQIALLREAVNQEWGGAGDKISIDTVERYQGSARDIIILSTSLHRESQLESISSLDDEGRDRKFNVALTRAREQFVVVGPSQILRKSKAYSSFIERAEYIHIESSPNEQT